MFSRGLSNLLLIRIRCTLSFRLGLLRCRWRGVKLWHWRSSCICIISWSKFHIYIIFSFSLSWICFLTELGDRKLGHLAIIVSRCGVLSRWLNSISFLTELRGRKLGDLIGIVIYSSILSCGLSCICFLTKLRDFELRWWRCSTTIVSWIKFSLNSILRLLWFCFCFLTELRDSKLRKLTIFVICSGISLCTILSCVLSFYFLLSKLWERGFFPISIFLLKQYWLCRSF